MREGWINTPIGDVAQVLSGFAFKSELFNESEGMPLIRIRDLPKRSHTEARYSGTYEDRYIVRKGDFLIGMDGEFHCYEWCGEDALLNQRVCRIQNFKINLVEPRFVYFAINKYLDKIEQDTGFTTVKHISSKQILAINIPLPPLPEQKRIVDLISAVDSYIDALKQQAESARKSRSAVLHEMLSAGGDDWTETTLGNLIQINRGGSPRPIQKYLTDDINGINWVKIADATASSKYIYETKQKILLTGVDKSRAVKSGDFILSNSMSYGRPYIMRTDGAIHDGWLLLSNIQEAFDEDFLYNLLLSDSVQKQFDALSAGSGVQNLNIEVVKQVTVRVPKKREQKEISKVLNDFDSVQNIYDETLLRVKELRSGLLSDLLSGGHEIPESYDKVMGAA
jgi:type I restriction enzyme, S subunit